MRITDSGLRVHPYDLLLTREEGGTKFSVKKNATEGDVLR